MTKTIEDRTTTSGRCRDHGCAVTMSPIVGSALVRWDDADGWNHGEVCSIVGPWRNVTVRVEFVVQADHGNEWSDVDTFGTQEEAVERVDVAEELTAGNIAFRIMARRYVNGRRVSMNWSL